MCEVRDMMWGCMVRNKNDEDQVNTYDKMRMIRMLSGKTLLAKIALSVLWEWTDIEDMNQPLGGGQLRCLGHLEQTNMKCYNEREKKTAGNVKRPKKT